MQGPEIAVPIFTMVELLNDFPSYVVAYQASGKVNQDEYERVVMSRVDQVAKQFDAINFIVKLETGMENYSLAALLDYLIISFKHIHRWNRMAIVSDQKTVRRFYDALSPLVPGKIIGYELKDFEKAKAWVSEPHLTDENLLRTKWFTGITAGIIGTSAMTLFSKTLSTLARENFSEPDLLGSLYRGWKPSLERSSAKATGWQTHYAIGITWALIYGMLRIEKRPMASSLLFGTISGVTGIYMWKKLFALNPRPPQVDRRNFYLQLFFAHLVFGTGVEMSYAWRASDRRISFNRAL
jgi:hypothetical protein